MLTCFQVPSNRKSCQAIAQGVPGAGLRGQVRLGWGQPGEEGSAATHCQSRPATSAGCVPMLSVMVTEEVEVDRTPTPPIPHPPHPARRRMWTGGFLVLGTAFAPG